MSTKNIDFNLRDNLLFGHDYIKRYYSGGIYRFDNLYMYRLLELIQLGYINIDSKHNDSPTVKQMIKFIEDVDIPKEDVVFNGFALSKSRTTTKNSSITIDSLCILNEAPDFVCDDFKKEFQNADELDIDYNSGFCYAWWD